MDQQTQNQEQQADIQKTDTQNTLDVSNLSENEQLKAILASQVQEMAELSQMVLSQIPENMRALIPDELTPVQKMRWYQKASAAGLLQNPTVPKTDTQKPRITMKDANPNDLPPIARMSAGYGN